MDKRDLVIGAITGYKFPQIAPWVNSLDRSGFDGIKAILAYNTDYDTIQELTQRGYSIFAFEKDDASRMVRYPKKDFSIVVERFIHYYFFLDTPQNREGIRYVIATDVKDVIFQENPSTWLTDIDPFHQPKIIVSSEGLQYWHEPWGANNMRQAFGDPLYEKHKENIIFNAGVLAGRFDSIMGLFKTIYLMCSGTPHFVPGGGGPDQAALNLLLATGAYEAVTMYTNHNSNWTAQLGTTMDPRKIQSFEPWLVESKPTFEKKRGLVVNSNGSPYTIVHQWDRVPEVKEMVERVYT